jgi:hypothetical protein
MSKYLIDIINTDNEPNIIEINMTRFRIIDPSGRKQTTKHSTIPDVINELNSGRCDLSLQNYFVECVIDDIEISADELLEAWNSGERPEDLQMF